MRKDKKNKENKDNNEKKVKEPISLKIKRKWLGNKTTTFFIVLIFILLFVLLNLLMKKIDLPEIDVTENKIFTLSDASKKKIADIQEEVNLCAFGFKDDSSLVDLLKQYNKANGNIKYELLSETSNKEKVEKYDLTDGYSLVVVEVGDASTILDAANDFSSYDYQTNQRIDLTEQKITNAILNLTVENKPKAYFLTGHGEYTDAQLAVLTTYLGNEAYDYDNLNLLSAGSIPEDCDSLIIMSPTMDLLENEADMIIDYINKGGNIIFTKDTEENGKKYQNFQKILDLYGIEIQNGYVLEQSGDSAISNYPNVIMPKVEYSEVTSELYSDGGDGPIIFVFAEKIKTLDEENAEALGVTYQKLLTSSENAYYVEDVSSNVNDGSIKTEEEPITVAVLAEKTINPTDNSEEESEEINDDEKIVSKIIVIGNGLFTTDNVVSFVSEQYPMSYIRLNKDFMLNSIAYLTNRKDALTIRKEMNNSTYVPTERQDTIVQIIIFAVPLLIIVTGIIIWNRRKNKR